jgi:hypothetical protein
MESVKTACLLVAVAASIVSLPLTLTYNDFYTSVFKDWNYDTAATDYWNNTVYPSPLGLTLGILAVVVKYIPFHRLLRVNN